MFYSNSLGWGGGGEPGLPISLWVDIARNSWGGCIKGGENQELCVELGYGR